MSQLQLAAFLDSSLVTAARVLGQATLVIVLTAILEVVFCRNAAARHAAWFCALLAVLISPVLVLAAASTGFAVLTIPAVAFPTWSAPAQNPSPELVTDASAKGAEGPFETLGRRASTGLVLASNERRDHPGAVSREHRLPAGSPRIIVRTGVDSLGLWRLTAGLFLLTWVVGAAALVVRLLRGHLVSRRLRRTAQPIDKRKWNDLLSGVAITLVVPPEQLPPIATLPALGEPITAGVLQPIVLMPEALLRSLTARQVVDVLVHECADVIRRDPLVGLLQRLAELLLWPHPLVHFMNRRLSQAREEVCDDHVLCAGDPIGYARTLVAVAEACNVQQPSSSLVTGLLTPRWTLESRVAGLLDARRIPTTTIHRGVLATVAAILLTAGMAVAGVRLGEPARNTQAKEAATRAPARPQRRQEQTRIIGLVVDEPGRPVAGTAIRVIGRNQTFTATSGPDGTFTLIVDEPILQNHVLHASANDGARQGVVIFPDMLYQPEATVKVVLKSARSVTVRVTDKQGVRVPNATIMVPVEISTSRGPLDVPLIASQSDEQGVVHMPRSGRR